MPPIGRFPSRKCNKQGCIKGGGGFGFGFGIKFGFFFGVFYKESRMLRMCWMILIGNVQFVVLASRKGVHEGSKQE